MELVDRMTGRVRLVDMRDLVSALNLYPAPGVSDRVDFPRLGT